MNLAAITRRSFRASHALFAAPMLLAAGCSDTTPPANEQVAPSSAAQTSSTPIVAYYVGTAPVSSIPFNSLTQINLAFLDFKSDGSGNIDPTSLPAASVSAVVTPAHAAGVKVLVSVGGGNADSIFNSLSQSQATTLAGQIASFVKNNGLDGADIDWEGVCGSPCGGAGGTYQTLIQTLRTDLNNQSPNLLLTAAMDAWGSYYSQNIPNSVIAELNQINVMAYDLEQSGSDPNATPADAQRAMSYWAQLVGSLPSGSALGVHGINLGMPFFGEAYNPANPSDEWPSIPYSSLPSSTDTYSSGGLTYSYDDIADVQRVTSIAMSNGAGVMMWTLDDDALGSPNSLLTAIYDQANPAQGSGGSCYWMQSWSPWNFQSEPSMTYQQCYQADGCYGGQNGSGGGCYKWATSISAPPEPWSGDGCYWMENWSPWTFVAEPGMTYQQCYDKDGCYGGLNQSGGGCYKWSSSPTGSRAPWTCAQTPSLCGEAPLQLWILPDYDNAKGDLPASTTAPQWFIENTGVTPYGISNYMNIYQNPSSGTPSFDEAKAEGFISDASKNGIHNVSISLATGWGDTDESAGLSALGAAVTYGATKQVTVWVRFGYEMNGSWSPSYNGGNPTAFQNTWAEVAGAVHAAGGKMVWAPNVNTGGGLSGYESWLPTNTSTIDIVGFDKYHQNGGPAPDLASTSTELSTAIAGIYPLVQQLGKPFILTETGIRYYDSTGWWPVANSSEVSEKQTWLGMIVAPSLRASYPLLTGFGWFDYNKQEGVSDGSTQYCDFSVSQQPLEASMFSAWVAANASSLQLQ